MKSADALLTVGDHLERLLVMLHHHTNHWQDMPHAPFEVHKLHPFTPIPTGPEEILGLSDKDALAICCTQQEPHPSIVIRLSEHIHFAQHFTHGIRDNFTLISYGDLCGANKVQSMCNYGQFYHTHQIHAVKCFIKHSDLVEAYMKLHDPQITEIIRKGLESDLENNSARLITFKPYGSEQCTIHQQRAPLDTQISSVYFDEVVKNVVRPSLRGE